MSLRKLITREIAGVRQRIRGTVLTEPRPLAFDTAGLAYPTLVVDVDVGSNRVLRRVPVKTNAALSRSYARLGAPVWLEKDGSRYQVVGPADRAVRPAAVVLVDEDAGTTGSGGTSGFTFQREPFVYYQGTPPETIYNPGADAAVRLWLRAYDRALGQPANITLVADADGQQVISLFDRSGHGSSPTQSTAGNRPLYRRFSSAGGNSNLRSTADFDGLDDRLLFPAAVVEATPGQVSIFLLLNKDAIGAGDDVVLELNHWRVYSRRAGGDTWGVDQGGGVSDSGSTLGTSFVLIEVVATSFGNFALYQDGALLGTFTPGGAGLGLGSSTLGGSLTLGSHDGRIAEVLVLDGAVSSSKRLLIESYFRTTMFVRFSRWQNGVDGFPKVRVFDSDGNEVTL